MKFYTSDLHFDHSNMLEYEHRPWKNVDEMNEGLLFRINTRVGVNDELYILGDFTLRSTRSAVEKFKAWKRLKDAGFKFISYNFNKLLADEENIDIKVILPECDSFKDDLDLLFGGEE